MPKLGDFLGDLLTEVTMARVQADLESVRIAELYANHPLLKHMPVPRFRLPMVKLDVPVLIRGEDLGDPDEKPKISPEEAAEKFIKILGTVSDDHDIQLLTEDRERVRRAAVLKVAEHQKLPPDVAGSITGTVTDLIKLAVRTIRKHLETLRKADETRSAAEDEHLLMTIRENLRRAAMTVFIAYVASPRRLEAEMTTSHVKEAGSENILARVTMEVTEDGMEWATVVDSDGELTERLVNE